jgi:hypothetical protein
MHDRDMTTPTHALLPHVTKPVSYIKVRAMLCVFKRPKISNHKSPLLFLHLRYLDSKLNILNYFTYAPKGEKEDTPQIIAKSYSFSLFLFVSLLEICSSRAHGCVHSTVLACCRSTDATSCIVMIFLQLSSFFMHELYMSHHIHLFMTMHGACYNFVAC